MKIEDHADIGGQVGGQLNTLERKKKVGPRTLIQWAPPNGISLSMGSVWDLDKLIPLTN